MKSFHDFLKEKVNEEIDDDNILSRVIDKVPSFASSKLWAQHKAKTLRGRKLVDAYRQNGFNPRSPSASILVLKYDDGTELESNEENIPSWIAKDLPKDKLQNLKLRYVNQPRNPEQSNQTKPSLLDKTLDAGDTIVRKAEELATKTFMVRCPDDCTKLVYPDAGSVEYEENELVCPKCHKSYTRKEAYKGYIKCMSK